MGNLLAILFPFVRFLSSAVNKRSEKVQYVVCSCLQWRSEILNLLDCFTLFSPVRFCSMTLWYFNENILIISEEFTHQKMKCSATHYLR